MVTEKTLKSILDELFSNHFEEFFCNVSHAGYITKSGHFITLPKEETINGYKCKISTGCSKITLIIDSDEEYVYKIPIKGEAAEDEFENYPNNIECENLIYRDSSEDMKTLLLENEFLFNYNSVPIYRQQRVEIIQGDNVGYQTYLVQRMSELDKEEAEKLYQEYCDSIRLRSLTYMNRNFFFSILAKFNFDCEYLIEEISSIDDLHAFNLGFINDEPVIFDYAGFLTEGDI